MDSIHRCDQRGNGCESMTAKNINSFVAEMEKSLPYPDEVRAQVGSEVRDHLSSLVTRYRREGANRNDAETQALAAFGTIDDFIARFEAEGGPTIAPVPASRGFAVFVGAYVGLVLGLGVDLVLGSSFWAMGLVGLVAGALGGRGLILRRNLGPLVGGALGAIVGNVAVAHYLFFHSEQSFSHPAAYESIALASTLIGAIVGVGIGLIPRLRNDPSPLLWATALGFGGHVIARMWLEDFPTLMGLITLALGLLVGGALGLSGVARRYALVPLGGMLGLTAAFIFIFFGLRYLEQLLGTSILFPSVNLAASLPIGAFIGAAVGLVVALRRKPGA